MRVAAIYDIHGNAPALEAVLEEIRQEAVDLVVVGGDVAPGPMPVESLALLRALLLPVRFIYGNGEVAVLAAKRGEKIGPVPEQARIAIEWTAGQLDQTLAEFLSAWPATVSADVDGIGEVLFCHASPRNENEIFTRETPAERLLPVFENVTAAVVVCGHTHMQFDRAIGGTRVINAGSVGMPYGKPGAYWLLLGHGVELKYTPYDLADAAQRIRATSYPQADTFAEHSILCPPTEQSMLERFASVQLS